MAFKPELSMTSHPSSDDVEQILREIDDVKQQVCNLELDMASASMQRQKAQIQSQLSNTEFKSNSEFSEGLRREIEATSVEKEFIDLARIEAESEYKRIKASHETDAANFIESMEKVKSRIMQLREEIKAGEALQKKLGITASEFNALQHEMEFTIRLMEKSTLKTRYVKDEQEVASLSTLHSSRVELDAAKKELSWLKQEGFAFMDAMDVTRKELTQLAKEKEKSTRAVKEYESRVQILEPKLHEAMSKMESASAAETRADAIVASLSVALRQLHSDIGATKREAELVREETKAVIEKAKSRTDSVEERLGAAMEALKNAKAAESMALEELQQVTESTMTERAILALWSDTITISKFEYHYLMKQGKDAKEVAEKKVTAALAWKEVFEAKEKEKRAKEESENVERWAIVAVDQERGNDLVIPRSWHNMKLAIAMPRRSLHVSGHSSSSLLRKQPSFTSIAPRTLEYSEKKGKLMEKVVRFLNGRRNCQSIKISACVI
ncbi:protein PLASTID MOVEMENT IMPAIRED 2-like [Curcuma longa]|uniref:protein PLASTID MOVEMENT IMPAIRED 2-like n=1 Tax=Curcuma longa TaxID=136217 RepID=UPI003D9DCF5E